MIQPSHFLRIPTLGKAVFPTPLPYLSEKKSENVLLSLNRNFSEDIAEPGLYAFEAAGPSSNLFFNPAQVSCAIVTCGGLCPGLNDVIRAVVHEAWHAYGVRRILGIRYGLEGFIPDYGHAILTLTPETVEHIHQFGGTLLGSSRGPQDPEKIADFLEAQRIDILFVIGGDGSMKAAKSISNAITARGGHIAVIGIPKTIDNDINFITKSFGFDTAVSKATEAVSCAHVEALGTHNGIGIVKLMGRESGFIAAQTALAMREANFVLIPEAPFALQGKGGLLPALERRLKERGHAVIIAAEGAGQHLMQTCGARDASGNIVLADIGDLLRQSIREYFSGRIPFSIKYIDPSYIIRSVPADANDRVYCGMLGQLAVHAGMAGKTDMVTASVMNQYVHIPLECITRRRRRLSLHSDTWRAVLECTGQRDLTGMMPSDAAR
ncbi:MAG: ATP-dependent 6-phosphofructokinase [Desulfovibrionaceae bacterium]|nr:ATP-dependent 6-phosphofructokinase [Desulfovibrionaceae bacterium]